MRVSNRVFKARRGGLWGVSLGRLSGGKGERFFALTPDRPCPPTAAVLAQILVRSPDFLGA